MASNAAMWQRSTVCRSWPVQNRPHSQRLCARTRENSQTVRTRSGSSSKTALKWAKSTWACWPGGVSKRRSKPLRSVGRTSRRKSVTAV